jgi:hypothetical protein
MTLQFITEEEFYSNKIYELWGNTISQMPIHDIGQTHEYSSLWWSTFKDNRVKKAILIILGHENAKNIIWPLMIRKEYFQNGIHIIGQIDGFITDYAIPILSFEQFSLQFVELLNYLKKTNIKWNYIKINIPEWANINISEILYETKKLNIHSFVKGYDKYSTIQLKDNFQSFISALGSKTRSDVRRYLKIYDLGGFDFKILKDQELKEKCSDLINLNSEAWGIFHNDLNKGFFEQLVNKSTHNRNGELIMPVLLFNEQVVAAVLGYMTGDVCFLHTAGVNKKVIKSISPGITLYVLIIKHLYEKGIRTLDFSPGLEDYKLRLGAKIYSINQIVVFRHTSAMLIYRTGFFLLKIYKFSRRIINKCAV